MKETTKNYGIWSCFVLIAAIILPVFATNIVYSGNNSKGEIMAIINGEDITRVELADFLIESYGKEGMEILTRRVLITQEAKKHNIKLSQKDIDERIDIMVGFEVKKLKDRYKSQNPDAFSLDLAKMGYDEDQLREKLAERVNMDVKPQLLAEKLISNTITITEEELKDVYEEKYGEKVQVRQIVVKTKEDAIKLLKKVKSGADFATLAKDVSIDRPSAAKGGLMPPISKRGKLGKSVALLKKGDITDIIPSRNGFYIFKVEGKVPPTESKSYKDALPELKKIALALNVQKRSGPWFLNLIESADIKNYLDK
ncbi:MAG: peptidylprolyl isomerase [Candidatus Anammoxibacter sp.]